MRGAKIIMIFTWLAGFTLALPLAIYRNYRVRKILQLFRCRKITHRIDFVPSQKLYVCVCFFFCVFTFRLWGCVGAAVVRYQHHHHNRHHPADGKNELTASGAQMEEFRGNILRGKYNIFANLLACYSIGDGTFTINRNDNLLFGHFLEGKHRLFPAATHNDAATCSSDRTVCVRACKCADDHFSNEVNDFMCFPAGSIRTESAEARKFNFNFVQNKSGTNAVHRCHHIHCITHSIHCIDFYTKSVAKEPGNGSNRRMVLHIVVHITLFAILECSRQSDYLWLDK